MSHSLSTKSFSKTALSSCVHFVVFLCQSRARHVINPLPSFFGPRGNNVPVIKQVSSDQMFNLSHWRARLESSERNAACASSPNRDKSSTSTLLMTSTHPLHSLSSESLTIQTVLLERSSAHAFCDHPKFRVVEELGAFVQPVSLQTTWTIAHQH